MISIELNNLKQIQDNITLTLEYILTLEYLGVHVEDTKEKDSKMLYYFSVLEKSTIETNDFLNNQIKTSDGLTQVAKDFLVTMIIDSCNFETDNSEENEEFYEDIKNSISNYVSFYVRIRYGEIWDKEMGQAAIQKITDELKSSSYKQI